MQSSAEGAQALKINASPNDNKIVFSFIRLFPIAPQPPREPLIVMKRGTDIPLLQKEVVRIT